MLQGFILGHTNTLAMIETLMEHIAMVVNVSAFDVRLNNMDHVKNKDIIKYMQKLREESDYDRRLKDIKKFNKASIILLFNKHSKLLLS